MEAYAWCSASMSLQASSSRAPAVPVIEMPSLASAASASALKRRYSTSRPRTSFGALVSRMILALLHRL
jgi:hypothetical protein